MEPVQHTVIQYTHSPNWPKNLVTAAQAAAELGISEQRLLELTEAGYAPHWRIDGGAQLYRVSDLKKWGARNLVRYCEGKPLQVRLEVHVEPIPCNNAPASIRGIAGLVELPTAAEPVVYFLVKGDEVIYVGQSISPLNRIGTHATDRRKDFDRVFMVPVPRSMLNTVEGALIRWLLPRLNCGPDGPRAPGKPENDVAVIETVYRHRPKPIEINGGKP